MAKWKNFEDGTVEMLKLKFGRDDVSFVCTGGSDSTQSDIQVLNNGQLLFYMEIKMSNAQSGQFVILDNGEKFEFSRANKSAETKEANRLIETVNQGYDYYKNVGTAAMHIDLDQEVFANWIMQHYQKNGVKYVVTKYRNDYVISPVEKYGEYFNITADLRRKRSGSKDLPVSWKLPVYSYLSTLYTDVEIQYSGERAYLCTSQTIVDRTQFVLNGVTFQLNYDGPRTYLIRKLSSTSNPNIIFSISSRKAQQDCDLRAFESDLNNIYNEIY